ncbi:esterase FE4-like [Sitophilus oryzae]|uniref:Carboxylic ester hydrolase n=1 Tax=Sitophilus oryzae TaxID=7048 RepID=A0A6J2XIE1_SITOR|nr:esterase FE4-like [Sitophilus oryzae]
MIDLFLTQQISQKVFGKSWNNNCANKQNKPPMTIGPDAFNDFFSSVADVLVGNGQYSTQDIPFRITYLPDEEFKFGDVGFNEVRDNNDLQLTLQDGIIQGQEETTISNKTFYSYVGVPYAKPPINDLRFREPQPPEKWTGILDATVEGPFCAGVNISAMVKMEFKPQGEEDCLYLNVYTPRDPKESNPRNLLPVLVFYYGGAFLGGGPVKDRYGADFFMENDLIVVLPHFRISIFGYLSTEDLECPGNWAVKDQLAVLKWVQTNIKRFGGDPGRVTIAGQSAGAVSVNSLFMSPKAKGLFHRAVIMSGSSLCFWAYQTDSRKIAFDLGIALGIETNDTKYLMQELRKVDSNAIMEAQLPVMLVNFMSALTNGLPFTPVVEPDHDGAVLTNYTFSLLEKGKFNKVPVMTGADAVLNTRNNNEREEDTPTPIIEAPPTSIIVQEIDRNSGRDKGRIKRKVKETINRFTGIMSPNGMEDIKLQLSRMRNQVATTNSNV